MFAPVDYLLHLLDESLPRDVDARTVELLLKGGKSCRPPKVGTVYGTLLNDQAALAALGDALNAAPYKAPPKAPILYIKPRNTVAGHGSSVVLPDNDTCVEIGASLGVVIGRTACRVTVDEALEFVGGYTTIADLSVPHSSVYRPSVRFRARDNFCVIGPAIVARQHVKDPDALEISVTVNDHPPFRATTATSVRGVAQLIADVTGFMTLQAGDVLTLGVPHGVPVAKTGDRVEVSINGWSPLRFSFKTDVGVGGAR
jgi:5-oxopent-3-ene-1,2,5-tricarboxylate decarboxylase/2-hydroxyhepta-2,4-diene-1,7-dioate isomerase